MVAVEGFSVVEDCVSDSIHSTKCSMLAYNLGAKGILQAAETLRDTPPRTPRISGLKSQILKPTF